MDDKNKIVRAWLLDFGADLHAAVGLHEMSQVIISPMLFDVPTTPHYCSEAVIVQDRILPVLDMPSLLAGQKIIHSHHDVVGVGVYQADVNSPIQYAGLRLATTPSTINVTNADACRLPDEQSYWKPFAISCIRHNRLSVPIIDLATLFLGKFELQGILKPPPNLIYH
jgi:chemotaxis signal transduction protein